MIISTLSSSSASYTPHMVLKVDNPMGTGLHLLPGDVEQHTGMVPSMLGVTKETVNLL
jgi:hypothetical protein